MPAKSPPVTQRVADKAAQIGHQIRERRKTLGVTAISAAESAGMSRVTWHRIERGELSVTFGAYLSAMDVLDMRYGVNSSQEDDSKAAEGQLSDWLPLRVRLSEYPQLKSLAWQVRGVDELTPREAFGFYQRNLRHLDADALEPREQQLIKVLRQVFDGEDEGV